MYKKIKRYSRKAQGIISAYRYARNNDFSLLSDVYSSYSSAKARAFKDCIDLMNEKNGYGLYITSHNTNVFTCAFQVDENNEHLLYYITPSNITIVILEDEETRTRQLNGYDY